MSQNKVHSQSDTNISVPFKWEKQPGVSKLIMKPKDQIFFQNKQDSATNLPLPPCWSDQKASSRKNNIPSYCSLRSYSKKHANFEKDPFLVAFKECTKTKSTSDEARVESRVGLVMIKKRWFRLCSNKACGVRDDALVKNQVLATYE